MLTEYQYDFCKKEANNIAKLIMDKDVSKVFGKDGGNANFILNTLVHLCAGSLYVLSVQVGLDYEEFLRIFSNRVQSEIEANKDKGFANKTIN